MRPDGKFARRYRVKAAGGSIHAEHGLAYHIETVVNGKTSGGMFDFGQDSSGVSNNIGLLGIDLGNVKAFSLSHGHFDHFMGAIRILELARPRVAAGTPFYVGEECFSRKFLLRPAMPNPWIWGS